MSFFALEISSLYNSVMPPIFVNQRTRQFTVREIEFAVTSWFMAKNN
jgi:hypothetical protein